MAKGDRVNKQIGVWDHAVNVDREQEQSRGRTNDMENYMDKYNNEHMNAAHNDNVKFLESVWDELGIRPEVNGWAVQHAGSLSIKSDGVLSGGKLDMQSKLSSSSNVVVTLEAPQGSLTRVRSELVIKLAAKARWLVDLQKGGAERIAGLLPQLPPWTTEAGQVVSRCSCCGISRERCSHEEQAIVYAARVWRSADPVQRLALLGLTGSALLAAGLAAWAQARPLPNAAETLRAALPAQQQKARPAEDGPIIAAWLAAMAEQGGLHAPAPQFHDIRLRLDVVDASALQADAQAAASPAGDAAAFGHQAVARLLPGVPRAAEGLGLVAEGVMRRAAELARQQSQQRP